MSGYAAEGLARLTSHNRRPENKACPGPLLKPLRGRGQGALSPSLAGSNGLTCACVLSRQEGDPLPPAGIYNIEESALCPRRGDRACLAAFVTVKCVSTTGWDWPAAAPNSVRWSLELMVQGTLGPLAGGGHPPVHSHQRSQCNLPSVPLHQ